MSIFPGDEGSPQKGQPQDQEPGAWLGPVHLTQEGIGPLDVGMRIECPQDDLKKRYEYHGP